MISSRELEREADYFALALLMPTNLFLEELRKAKLDYGDDQPLIELAKKFDVSLTMVCVRMSMLKNQLKGWS